MKKLLFLFFLTIITLCCSSCINSIPSNDINTTNETNDQDADVLSENPKVRRSMLNDDEKEIYDKYLPYALSYTPFEFNYINEGYDMDSVHNALYSIWLDYPETWLYFGWGFESDIKKSGEEYSVYYTGLLSSRYRSLSHLQNHKDDFDKEYVNDYIEKINDECNNILKQMPKKLSTKEKYIWIAKYLCSITEYYNDGESDYLYADGPILYGKGVCQSYAYAYQWLCQKAGLWCITCSGMAHGEAHCWNVVKLDNGQTYYMDLTWADDSKNPDQYYFMTYEECTKKRELDEGEWIADGE